MKILFLSHRTPYPPNKGDKIRSFNVLRHLAESHEVHLVTLVDDPGDVGAITELAHRVRGVLHARIDQPGRKLLSLRAMLSHESISVRYFYSKVLQARVDDLIGRESFDAVVCSSSPMAEYVFRSAYYKDRLAGALKIMDLIDVDSYKWRQYAARASAPSALVYRYESRRLEDYERRIYRDFDWVLLVSEQERSYFAGGDPLHKLVAVSNGVDLVYFNREHTPAEPPSDIPAAPTIVFTGMMDYWPNVEGMQWFIDSVFPRVRAAIPGVRLYVVGGRPSRSVLRWAESVDVVVTGFVPDVRVYVAKADVCIAPLRVARGIQNKVLEAMAMGKAVVSTPEAHEGLDADPQDELLVANGELAFGDGVIALLRDPERATRLGEKARRCVERRYSWATNLQRLDDLLGARAACPAPTESIREPTIAGA